MVRPMGQPTVLALELERSHKEAEPPSVQERVVSDVIVESLPRNPAVIIYLLRVRMHLALVSTAEDGIDFMFHHSVADGTPVSKSRLAG